MLMTKMYFFQETQAVSLVGRPAAASDANGDPNKAEGIMQFGKLVSRLLTAHAVAWRKHEG